MSIRGAAAYRMPSLKPVGRLLVALAGVTLAASSLGSGHLASASSLSGVAATTTSASSRGCPAREGPPASSTRTRLATDPVSAELCPDRSKHSTALKGGPGGGVALGKGPARALARAVATARPAGAVGATCATLTPTVVVRFFYRSAPAVPVDVVTSRCPEVVAYVSGKGRLINPALATMLPAMSAPRPAIALTGSPGPVPDLFGEGSSAAARIAEAAGYSLVLTGEEVDPAAPAGTVLLQSPPAGSKGVGNQIDLIIDAHLAPSCRSGDLGLAYLEGGEGSGNDFGTIIVTDLADSACQLSGPITLVGVDAAGQTVTQSVTYPVAPGLILTPETAPSTAGQSSFSGDITAALRIGAEYRDDPSAPDGLCTDHQVTPAAWVLTFGDGARTLPNNSERGSLETCRGEIENPSPVAAS